MINKQEAAMIIKIIHTFPIPDSSEQQTIEEVLQTNEYQIQHYKDGTFSITLLDGATPAVKVLNADSHIYILNDNGKTIDHVTSQKIP